MVLSLALAIHHHLYMQRVPPPCNWFLSLMIGIINIIMPIPIIYSFYVYTYVLINITVNYRSYIIHYWCGGDYDDDDDWQTLMINYIHTYIVFVPNQSRAVSATCCHGNCIRQTVRSYVLAIIVARHHHRDGVRKKHLDLLNFKHLANTNVWQFVVIFPSILSQPHHYYIFYICMSKHIYMYI